MKKEYVIILVIAALAAIWYFFIRNASTAAVVAPPVTSTGPLTQAAVVNGPPATLATATGASQVLTQAPDTSPAPTLTVQPGGAAVIDSSQYDAIILPWMNGLGAANKQQALKMYPSMTDSEKASLADIIVNVWGGKRQQTSADTVFWNTWRVKYHVLDGTYSPFTEDAQIAYAGKNNFDDPQTALNGFSDPQKAYNGFVQKGASVEAYNGFSKKRVRKS